jgi:hypothetical protein
LKIESADSPANDNFADRISMTGATVQTSGSTIDATVEGWEQPNSYYFRHPTSIWWEWTAPDTGTLVVTARSDEFDPAMWIYQGTIPNTIQGLWTVDEGKGMARLEPWVEAGKTYYISVGNRYGGMGDVDLQLKLSGELDIRVAVPSMPVGAGSPITLRVSGSDSTGTFGYQWLRNGVEIPGANGATYEIKNAQLHDVGAYSVRVFGSAGFYRTEATSLSVAPPISTTAGRMTSLSTLALSLTGDNGLIPGFVIQGTGTKKLLIRAVGPTLAEARFGIADALPDPQMVVK